MWVWEMLQLNKNIRSQNTCWWQCKIVENTFFEHIPLFPISSLQTADLLPVTSYKTWWLVGLWVQETDCVLSASTVEKETPRGDAGQLVEACWFKSRFKKSLSTSWNQSSCCLFPISRVKLQTECTVCWMEPAPFVSLQLLSESCLGQRVDVSLFFSFFTVSSVSSSL